MGRRLPPSPAGIRPQNHLHQVGGIGQQRGGCPPTWERAGATLLAVTLDALLPVMSRPSHHRAGPGPWAGADPLPEAEAARAEDDGPQIGIDPGTGDCGIPPAMGPDTVAWGDTPVLSSATASSTGQAPAAASCGEVSAGAPVLDGNQPATECRVRAVHQSCAAYGIWRNAQTQRR